MPDRMCAYIINSVPTLRSIGIVHHIQTDGTVQVLADHISVNEQPCLSLGSNHATSFILYLFEFSFHNSVSLSWRLCRS